MEERRLRGARLLKEGVSQAEVAQQLGVKRQSVHEWAKVMAEQGEKGLARVPTGRKSRLNAVQLAQLIEGLANDFLVGERAIDFRRIKKGDAAIHGLANERDALLPT